MKRKELDAGQICRAVLEELEREGRLAEDMKYPTCLGQLEDVKQNLLQPMGGKLGRYVDSWGVADRKLCWQLFVTDSTGDIMENLLFLSDRSIIHHMKEYYRVQESLHKKDSWYREVLAPEKRKQKEKEN